MQQIIESMHGAVAEGVATTKAAKILADKLGLQTPIIQGLYRILFCECYVMCSTTDPVHDRWSVSCITSQLVTALQHLQLSCACYITFIHLREVCGICWC